MKSLKVVEIFHSIQGEGRNVGRSAVFVRLSDCNLNCDFCDTDWSKGNAMTPLEILAEVHKYSSPADYPNNLLIWTGGEPTLQLTEEIIEVFSGYYNCIETNGTNEVPSNIDYISCSPKVAPSKIKLICADEFRYPIEIGGKVPDIDELPPAQNYYVSPLFSGNAHEKMEANAANIAYCINFVNEHPQWKLSVQIHKFLNIR